MEQYRSCLSLNVCIFTYLPVHWKDLCWALSGTLCGCTMGHEGQNNTCPSLPIASWFTGCSQAPCQKKSLNLFSLSYNKNHHCLLVILVILVRIFFFFLSFLSFLRFGDLKYTQLSVYLHIHHFFISINHACVASNVIPHHDIGFWPNSW